MIRASFFATLTCLALLAQSGTAWAWTNADGGDHAGANWAPATGAEIAGTHTNVGDFSIPFGRTVYVKRYNGSSYGMLTIDSESINIQGILNGTGRGYGGGGGGGGGSSTTGPRGCANDCFPTSNGAKGTGYGGGSNGAKGYKTCSNDGTSISGKGGKGGGTYRGAGAARVSRKASQGVLHGKSGVKGGYRAAATNGDNSTNETVWRGSGGGGGSGAAHAFENNHSSVGGNGGGGAGGGGGAAISLVSDGGINITGSVLTKGADGGGDGSQGDNGYHGSYKCDLQGSGGSGGSAGVESTGDGATGVAGYFVGSAYNSCINRKCNIASNSYGRTGGNGGSGGAGAGGGLLLKGSDVNVTGTVDSRGGKLDTTNGGTLKIVYCDLNFTTDKGLNGKYVPKEATDCGIDIGLRIHEGNVTKRISADKDLPPKSPVKVYRNGRAYGLTLVDPGHARATKTQIRVGGETKAFRNLD